MKIKTAILKDPERNNKYCGMEIEFRNNYCPDNHCVSLFINENFDLNCYIFKNGIEDNNADLSLLCRENNSKDFFKKIIGNEDHGYFKFNNDETYLIMRKEYDGKNQVDGFYTYMLPKEDVGKLKFELTNEILRNNEDIINFMATVLFHTNEKQIGELNDFYKSVLNKEGNKQK